MNHLGAHKDDVSLEAAKKIEKIFAAESNATKRNAMVQVVVIKVINSILKKVSS